MSEPPTKRDMEVIRLYTLFLLIIHHEETRLNANHNPNLSPKGGNKGAIAPFC